MPKKVMSAAEAAKKWGETTPGRQAYYEANAKSAGGDWEKGATDAAGSFKTAVSAANIEKMFLGGIKRAGAAKYARKVETVGAQRFSQGVQAAVGDMQSGIEPFLATIASVTPPPRAPRGSPANLARVSAYSTELNKKRLALRAAGA